MGRWPGARAATAGIAALAFTAATPAQAQVYQFSAGTSTLPVARGGSMQVFGSNYQGRFDVGYLDRPTLGVQFQGLFRGRIWGAGDQNIAFGLSTDPFNTAYLFARGVSVERTSKTSRLLLFAGATSRRFVLPFFSGASADTPAAIAFYERQIRPALRLMSQNMVSSRQTSIQTLQWKPAAGTVVAIGGGVGSNRHYAASSLTLDRPWLSLRTGYTVAGREFGRVPIASAPGVEGERENVLVRLHSAQRLQVSFSRQNLVMQSSLSRALPGSLVRARVNGVAAGAAVSGALQLRGSYFESTSDSRGVVRRSQGTTMGATGRIGSLLEAQLDVFENRNEGLRNRFAVATIRERINRRFMFSQTVTRTIGGTTVSYGGQISSNLVSVGAESQVVFLPFAPSQRGGFRQSLQLTVRLRLPHDTSFNLNTYLNALGEVRYTAYGTGYAYGTALDPAGRPPSASARVRMSKYLVKGRVVDTNGGPVQGAALRIGEDVVFSDSDGNFTSRQSSTRQYPVSVLVDQFMFDGVYEPVSAPAAATAAVESRAQTFEVVLRRVR